MAKQASTNNNESTLKFLYQTTPFNSSLSSCQILTVQVFFATCSGSGSGVERLTATFTSMLSTIIIGASIRKWKGMVTPAKYLTAISAKAITKPEINPENAPFPFERFQNNPRKNVPTIGGARYETIS